MSRIWRRMVLLKWKADACPSAIERAFNMHRSFARDIPSVLSVSEARTFTGGPDGGGAYPGEHDVNRGYHSAVELIMDCESPEQVKERYMSHAFHTAAAAKIDPLIEAAWPLDWLEERSTLAVPPATSSFVKHIVYFKWTADATPVQRGDLLAAWRETIPAMPGVLAMSCGEAVRWERGEQHGYDCCISVDLDLKSPDGIQELHDYHSNEDFLKVAKAHLRPIRKDFAVLDCAFHSGGMNV